MNKEIEEMAKVINNPERNWCEFTVRCSDCPYTNKSCKEYTCRDYAYAETLYNVGYRQCKDKVVLTREEYDYLINDCIRWEKLAVEKVQEINKARKETARELLFKFESAFAYYDNEDMFSKEAIFECIEELAKQFGVEVEDGEM